jgi:Trk K+ transport system NAD-binding subunit
MLIVRDGTGIAPRGSTTIAAGDRLYILVAADGRPQVEELLKIWERGPMPTPLRIARESAT